LLGAFPRLLSERRAEIESRLEIALAGSFDTAFGLDLSVESLLLAKRLLDGGEAVLFCGAKE
jgi:hypothetical protein